jgi:transketolase
MEKFYLPQDSVGYFRQAVPHGAQMEDQWRKKLDAYKQAFPEEAAEFEGITSDNLPQNWDIDLPKWKPNDKPISTRAAGGEAMYALAKHIPNLIGGSADLNPSTRTALRPDIRLGDSPLHGQIGTRQTLLHLADLERRKVQ